LTRLEGFLVCPIHYFDIRCGAQTHRDEKGVDAAGATEAIKQAAEAASDFLKERFVRGQKVEIDEIIIRNQYGEEVARVNIRALNED
jgi:hypothetical protein